MPIDEKMIQKQLVARRVLSIVFDSQGHFAM
jgi:hypothetical protein